MVQFDQLQLVCIAGYCLNFSFKFNDIFLIPTKSSLHNYADDNTLSYSHKDPDILIHNLQHDCIAI